MKVLAFRAGSLLRLDGGGHEGALTTTGHYSLAPCLHSSQLALSFLPFRALEECGPEEGQGRIRSWNRYFKNKKAMCL